MKALRFFISASLFVCAVLCTLFLVSCDGKGDGGHRHQLQLENGVPATCKEDGVARHWSCECGKRFSYADLTIEVSDEELVLRAEGHDGPIDHYEQISATCTADGVVEHWFCRACGGFFADAEAKTPLSSTVAPATQHMETLSHVVAKAPTCLESGNVEYWTCTACGLIFSDADATIVIFTVTLPATMHKDTITYHAPLAPTCDLAGNIEYWSCAACESFFANKYASELILDKTSVVRPATHSFSAEWSSDGTQHWHAATCEHESERTDIGDHVFDEYYYCEVCQKPYDGLAFFLEADNTYTVRASGKVQGDISIPAVYNGLPVTTIEWGGFSGKSEMTSIYIPDSIVEIRPYAFRGCTSLTELVIPDTVTTIGSHILEGCAALERLTAPLRVSSNRPLGVWFGSEGAEGMIAVRQRYEETTNHVGTYYLPAGLTELTFTSGTLTQWRLQNLSMLERITLPAGLTEIPRETFSGCTALSAIDLPDSVTAIGTNAFLGCATLETVSLSDELLTIGWSAFEGCVKLKDIILPEKLTTIGQYAFKGCVAAFTALTIPESVTSIEYGAFSGCANITSLTLYTTTFQSDSNNFTYPLGYFFGGTQYEGGTQVHQFTCNNSGISWSSGTEYCLPAGLTEITLKKGNLANAFLANMKQLTSVTLHDEITEIGARAFAGCSGLTSIDLPESIETLGAAAFCYCSGLERFTFPSKVTVVPYDLLAYCTSLTTLTIPAGVTKMEFGMSREGILRGCSALESITVPFLGYTAEGPSANSDTSTYLLSALFGQQYFEGCVTVTQQYVKNSYSYTYTGYLPAALHTVTVLGGGLVHGAFSGCYTLKEINLPATLIALPAHALDGCKALTQLYIPEGVVSIGEYALQGCEALFTVNLPASLTALGKQAFVGCVALEQVHIGNINAFAAFSFDTPESNPLYYTGGFYQNGALVTVLTLSEGVAGIGKYAFYGCISLQAVALPASVQIIGTSAFENCASIEQFILQEGLQSVGSRAFANCSKLRALHLPTTVIGIGNAAFTGCGALERMTLPVVGHLTGNDYMGYQHHPIGFFFGTEAYQNSIAALPDSLGVVYRLPAGLTIVTVNATEVPSMAFYGCTSIKEVVLSADTTKLGDYAFAYSGISAIKLGNVLDTVGTGTFLGCSALASFEIGSATTAFRDNAFKDCTALKDVHIADFAAYCTNTFSTPTASPFCNGATLYLDGVAVTALRLPESVEKLPAYAFWGCMSLTEAYVPASVTSIGQGALGGCASLQKLTVPFAGNQQTQTPGVTVYPMGYVFGTYEYQGGVRIEQTYKEYTGTRPAYVPESLCSIELLCATELAYGAFSNFHMLTSITLPATLTTIGNLAFSGCTSLALISLPANLEAIGDSAFSGCKLIESITIPATVQCIGINAFSGCEKLADVTFARSGPWYIYNSWLTNYSYYTPSTAAKSATDLTKTHVTQYWYADRL